MNKTYPPVAVAALACAVLLLGASGCKKTETKQAGKGDVDTVALSKQKATPRSRGVQVPPPENVGKIPTTVKKTPAGVAYEPLSSGNGTDKPARNDTVKIRYTAWKADGTTQFTTIKRKQPMKMSLATTGPGWTEVLQLMTVGDKWRMWMTPQLAFGARAKRAGNELLTYEVELVAIERAPAIPVDVAAPPADATTTPSGLAYKLLKKGTGKIKPRYFDEVSFHFTGWTTDGTMIDSTIVRGKPRKTLLFREMPGWTEGIQTMVVGEKKRFWLPEPLTETLRWQKKGMHVYDVELLSIKQNPAPPPAPKDVAGPPANAEKTPLGVSFVTLKPGTGTKHPGKSDIVRVNYTGWTSDGKMFDSSIIRGAPASIPLSRVIPGWGDAMATMVVGERKRVWIPDNLAYKGRTGPQGTLVFDLELVSITEKPKPPKTPADVAAPPADAQKTPEGVFYKMLKPGTGKVHPTPKSSVTAHYAGWTTDGKMFDTSITRSRPSTFSMDGVIKGWTIGLQKMVVGEKARFWIPEELAYRGQKGKPAGMLVFDVELMAIK